MALRQKVKNKPRTSPIRLKNPLARKMYQNEIKKEWDTLKNITLKTSEHRYDFYKHAIQRALQKTTSFPHLSAKNIELIKLKQEQRLAYWQYKVLTSRGQRTNVAKERRDNLGRELRRRTRRADKKRRDLR